MGERSDEDGRGAASSHPRLVLQVERTALADPWLGWLHERLAERARVSVHAIEAEPDAPGERPEDRVPGAVTGLDADRMTGWLERIERRMADDVAWPSHVLLEPEPTGGLGPPDIVLELTAADRARATPGNAERWWLLVGGERLVPGDRRTGHRDVERRAPTTELLLVRACGDGATVRVLARTAHDTRWGGVLNRRVVLGKVPTVLGKGLERWNRGEHLVRSTDETDETGATDSTGPAGAPGRARGPGDLDVADADPSRVPPTSPERPEAGSSLDRAARLVRHEWRRRLHNVRRRLGRRPGMWSLYVGRGDPLTARLADAVELRPRANEYWADPFLWRRDGRTFVYYEAYDYRTTRGRIAVGELSGTGPSGTGLPGTEPSGTRTPGTEPSGNGSSADDPFGRDIRFDVIGDVLSPSHHLSYPFLVEHAGELLMIPECSRLGRVEIWRCTRFPDRFERVATRLEGWPIVDLTLFRRDGQWWMFCAMADDDARDTNGALHAFAVNGPTLDEIVPHARNPIVTDSRTARPGGRVFERDGRWYRPSQDNSHGVYGHGLNLMEIRTLTLEDYEETVVRTFDADFAPGLVGVHHLDVNGESFVVDGCHALGGRPSRRARSA